MADSFAIDLAAAQRPLVLSIDVGSTGIRGGVFDATGRPVTKTRVRVDHQFRTDPKGKSEISPDLVVAGVVSVIDGVVRHLKPRSIAAVCVDTFASSLIGIDDDAAVTPCYTYAESRPAVEIPALRGYISEARLQQRTGTRFHASYVPAGLRWLARTQPDTFELVDEWMSIGEYIYLRLLNVRGAATSTAAWSGLLNRHDATWDSELLTTLGVRPGQFADIRMPDEPFDAVAPNARKRWPALDGALWFPAVPDGYANHFGSGHGGANTVVLSASMAGALRVLVDGTPPQVPAGLWCYRVDRTSSLVGGALNDVGNLVRWLDGITPAPASGNRNDYFHGPPLEGSPIVLPFITGERSTGWRGDARAVFAEVSNLTDVAALYRGVMEGVAMTYRRIVEQIQQVSPQLTGVIAASGVVNSLPGWLEVVAGVLDMPVTPLTLKRSTLRGNAVLALNQLVPEVPRAVPELGPTIRPDRAAVAAYQQRYERFLELYETMYGH